MYIERNQNPMKNGGASKQYTRLIGEEWCWQHRIFQRPMVSLKQHRTLRRSWTLSRVDLDGILLFGTFSFMYTILFLPIVLRNRFKPIFNFFVRILPLLLIGVPLILWKSPIWMKICSKNPNIDWYLNRLHTPYYTICTTLW